MQHVDNSTDEDSHDRNLLSDNIVKSTSVAIQLPHIGHYESFSALDKEPPPSASNTTSAHIGHSESLPNEQVTDGTSTFTPITVSDEILGPDKGKISALSTVTNTSAACRKSEQILTKFWADELETDQASDSDLDNNTDRPHDFFPESNVVDQYLLQHTETTKKGKRGRPRKPKSPKVPTSTKTKNKKSSELLVLTLYLQDPKHTVISITLNEVSILDHKSLPLALAKAPIT